ncbi:sensor histidine kinase [Oxalobacteraceae bacterium A2-2]
MSLPLRARFLLLCAVILVLTVSLLAWNSQRLMARAVGRSADRVAQEYATTLNLSLSPYAASGRLAELRGYLAEMLADPDDSFVRYIVVLDQAGTPLVQAGQRPAVLPDLDGHPEAKAFKGVRTLMDGGLLHARAPLLLRDNRVGSINFGLSTMELRQAREEVIRQGGMIGAIGLMAALVLLYAFTHGIGRRLRELMAQSQLVAAGDYSQELEAVGSDEVAAFARALNTMRAALLDRIAQLQQSERRLALSREELKDLNVSLETRVRQRSAELEQANAELNAAVHSLQRTQHELLASEKMASLGSLVAGIAHELNTPIGNSLLASTALRDRVADFEAHVAAGALRRSELNAHLEEVRMASNLIAGSLQKAAELISSFKQIAVDQTSDQRRCFDLLGAVQDTVATYLPRLRRADCTVQVRILPGVMLDSYPGSWYQILNNLLNNALTHAFQPGQAGVITIEAQEQEQGGLVTLSFADNGAGMADEVLRHVFDPFFTTRMGQGGTGLGMHIVYNIVTGALGGRIALESAPGLGTTVRMTLPKVSPQRSQA